MNLEAFQALPDVARIWIYGFEKTLEREHRRIVDERLSAFMRDWNSHKVDVHGAYAILEDRFVVLAGASRDGISGCSIDSTVENFKYLRDAHGLDGLNRSLVYFRDGAGMVRALDRGAFQREVHAGRCGPDTIVFDTTLQTLGDLRIGCFEQPLRDSWHARLFMSNT